MHLIGLVDLPEKGYLSTAVIVIFLLAQRFYILERNDDSLRFFPPKIHIDHSIQKRFKQHVKLTLWNVIYATT